MGQLSHQASSSLGHYAKLSFVVRGRGEEIWDCGFDLRFKISDWRFKDEADDLNLKLKICNLRPQMLPAATCPLQAVFPHALCESMA